MAYKQRISSIDIARLIASVLVIAIHTQAVTWFRGYNNGNIQILTRLAVPFFFCTSGYFLHKNYINKGCSALVISLGKTIRIYTLLSLAYFAVIYLTNPVLLHKAKAWMLVDFLFNGSYYHLWYMVGVVYSMATIYSLCKLKLTGVLLPLAVICYIIGLLGTSYYSIGCRLPVLSTLFDCGWFLSIRRIFLMGFPFTVLGWTISEGKLKLHGSNKMLLFVASLMALLFVFEIIGVTVTKMSRSVEITVFLYPLLCLLFQICLAYPIEEKSSLASICYDTANFTYFWHPLIILALRKTVDISFLLFIITTTVCLLLGFCYHSLKDRRNFIYEYYSKSDYL